MLQGAGPVGYCPKVLKGVLLLGVLLIGHSACGAFCSWASLFLESSSLAFLFLVFGSIGVACTGSPGSPGSGSLGSRRPLRGILHYGVPLGTVPKDNVQPRLYIFFALGIFFFFAISIIYDKTLTI